MDQVHKVNSGSPEAGELQAPGGRKQGASAKGTEHLMLAEAEGKVRRTKADLHGSEASLYLSYVTESQTQIQNEAQNRQPNTPRCQVRTRLRPDLTSL